MSLIKFIAAIGGAGAPAKKILMFFVGDSITFGVGTTGTTASSNGASQVAGPNTYPKQAEAILNTSGNTFTYQIYGYPGQNIDWYISNHQSELISYINVNKASYDQVIVMEFFSANDLCLYPASHVLASKVSFHNAVRATGATTLTMLPIPRNDIYANAPNYAGDGTHFEDGRQNLITLLKGSSTFSGLYADLSGKHIYETYPPTSDDYAVNDVDGLSYVHPNDTGASQLAAGAASKILTLIN